MSGRVRPSIPDGPWLVCGLARSGQAAALLLRSLGHEVVAVDAAAPEGAAGLSDAGVEVHLDAAGADLVSGVAAIAKSPGVPREAPVPAAARRLGVPIIGELELGWRATSGPVIAVTGTNGKTTVSELTGHLLRTAGVETTVAGNVGRPLASLAGTPAASASVVAEASSFQLEDCVSFDPEVAVILNLGSDHLDRHGSLADYHEAKLSMLDRQGSDSVAVVPAGGGPWDGRGAADRLTFGPGGDLFDEEGRILFRGAPIADLDDLSLPGRHNVLNVEAACAAAIASGVSPGALADGLRSFAGVPHRLQTVANRGGVRWINDSKATNVESAVTALEAVGGGVRLILGGEGKSQDFSPLRAATAAACESVHLIGEAAGELAEVLSDSGVHVQQDGDLRLAVAACARLAGPGQTVLLAPACASFDQFDDFEQRGSEFARLVEEYA